MITGTEAAKKLVNKQMDDHDQPLGQMLDLRIFQMPQGRTTATLNYQ